MDVSSYVRGKVRDPAEVEDVTQTTFLNAYIALRRGERPRMPGHWLIVIARNTCRARFRYDSRRPQEVGLVEEVSAAAVAADDEVPTVSELQRALLGLPATQRAALVMRELEGRHSDEIGLALGISISAVETLLFRARRSLREQLEEQLSCHAALVAVSKRAEGRLTSDERPGLRAHLRRCPECARVDRSKRARRTGLRTLLPPPSWLFAFLARSSTSAAPVSGSSSIGAGALLAKAAAIVVAGAVVGGSISEGAKQLERQSTRGRQVRVAAAIGPPHRQAITPRAHTPLRAEGTGARPSSSPASSGAVTISVPSVAPGLQPIALASPTVSTIALASPTVSTATGTSQTSAESGQTAAPPAGTHGQGAETPARSATPGNRRKNALLPGNHANAKATERGQAKKTAIPPGNNANAKATERGQAKKTAIPPGNNANAKATEHGQAKKTAIPPGNSVDAKATAQGHPKTQSQAAASADAAPVLQKGQANGQGNVVAGQGNGPPTATPAATPAAPPAQSNAGGNGHH